MSLASQKALGQAIQRSTGMATSEYMPCYVEPARIVNVNLEDWSVDAVAEFANKRFFDMQVMAPYFNYANGEGIYVMPEVGAYAWVAWESTGRNAQPFILGFKAPFDEQNISYRCNRQTLNPGDIMLRTRDENFVILRRGGVLQIGATPVCQTMYVPINNILRHFCENFELNAFGGDLKWTVTPDKSTYAGNAPAEMVLRAKQFADDPEFIAELSIGSHGPSSPVTLELVIRDSGLKGNKEMVKLQIGNDGSVTWTTQKDFTLNVTGNVKLQNTKGDFAVATDGNFTAAADKDLTASSKGQATMSGDKGATVKSGKQVVLDAPQTYLGGAGATEPVILGQQLVSFLTELLAKISAIASQGPVAPTNSAMLMAPLMPKVTSIISSKVFTK